MSSSNGVSSTCSGSSSSSCCSHHSHHSRQSPSSCQNGRLPTTSPLSTKTNCAKQTISGSSMSSSSLSLSSSCSAQIKQGCAATDAYTTTTSISSRPATPTTTPQATTTTTSSRPQSPYSPCFDQRPPRPRSTIQQQHFRRRRKRQQQQPKTTTTTTKERLFQDWHVRQRVNDFVGDRRTQQFWIETVRKDIEQCLVDYKSKEEDDGEEEATTTTSSGTRRERERKQKAETAAARETTTTRTRDEQSSSSEKQRNPVPKGLQKHRQRLAAEENEKFLVEFRRRQQQKQHHQRYRQPRGISGYPLSPVAEQRPLTSVLATTKRTMSRGFSVVTRSPTSTVEIEWNLSCEHDDDEEEKGSKVQTLYDALGDAETVVASGNAEKQGADSGGSPSYRQLEALGIAPDCPPAPVQTR